MKEMENKFEIKNSGGKSKKVPELLRVMYSLAGSMFGLGVIELITKARLSLWFSMIFGSIFAVIIYSRFNIPDKKQILKIKNNNGGKNEKRR